MIDIWLFFSLFFLAALMAFHAYISYTKRPNKSPTAAIRASTVSVHPIKVEEEDDDDEASSKADRYNWFGRLIFAAVGTVFLATFWTVAMVEYLREPDSYE